jgi:hypothetical protein
MSLASIRATVIVARGSAGAEGQLAEVLAPSELTAPVVAVRPVVTAPPTDVAGVLLFVSSLSSLHATVALRSRARAGTAKRYFGLSFMRSPVPGTPADLSAARVTVPFQ